MYYRYILFLFFSFLFVKNTLADTDIELILNRHKEYLLRKGPDKEKVIPELVASFNLVEKRWNNIDYGDKQRAVWRVSDHLRNIKALAIHWSDPKSEWYKDRKLFQVIVEGLDDWAMHKYQNPNWWHNEIGVPQLMRDILVLIRSELSQAQMKNYLPVLNQHRIASDGANLIWSADLGLFYGLFTRNFKLIDSAVSAIVNEIKFSEKDGLKPDFSFHQHGPRLQMYQYGAAFLLDNIRIAWELQESRWAYPDRKVELLTSMLLNGWQWMARGIYTVPNTMDRSATRPDELNKTDVRLYISLFKDLVPNRTDELNMLKNIQNSDGSSLAGFRYFPYSDFAAYHRPDFSFFLKTISSRTLSSESFNNENLKGHLMNSGETYFMQDGGEYFNMMPVWDWEKLPGITAFSGADVVERNDFAGSVSDGDVGFSSMDYTMSGKDADRSISGKKTWMVYKDYVLCLMSNITMENLDLAYTMLDQSRWRGAIKSDLGNLNGVKQQKPLKWVRHNDFVYFTLGEKDRLLVKLDTVQGSWYSINNGYSSSLVKERVFMPYIQHEPATRSYAYVVTSATHLQTDKVISKQPFTIARNDENCQTVTLIDGTVAATFYKAGTLNLKAQKISVDRPCQLLIRKGKLFISDPTHKGGTVSIKYNYQNYLIDLHSDGTTTSIVL